MKMCFFLFTYFFSPPISLSLDVSFNCLKTCARQHFFSMLVEGSSRTASLCIHHRHSDTTPSSGQLNENKHLNSFFGFFIIREASLVCRAQPT